MDVYGTDRQSDIEALSAWMDGELPPEDAQRVAERVRADPAWRATYEHFRALDEALARLPVPQPGPGLTERILRSARRRSPAGRVLRYLAPLAAAAAIVAAIVAAWPSGSTDPLTAVEQEIVKKLPGMDAEQRFIVVNLPMFEKYQEVDAYREVHDVVDAKTLAALARLEGSDGGM